MTDTATIATTVIIGALIVGGLGYTYYTTSNSLASLSQENANLNQQLVGVSQQNANLNQQVASLGQQVSTLEQRTVQVVTVSNTVVSVVTSVSVTSVTSTFTSTVYPVPDNVTVVFTQVSGGYNYVVTAGSTTYTGSHDTPFTLPITPVYQGEVISISASETGLGGCAIGQTVTAQLYLNGTIVAQGTEICTGSNIQITYTI